MRLTLLLFIALGGCATTPAVLVPASPTTPAALESASPRPTYTTVKQPKMIADCLQQTIGPVALVREGNQAVITFRNVPELALHIFDNGRVEVWHPIPFEGQIRSSVQSCI